MNDLIMIKWGGSLITEKDKPFTPRIDIIRSLARQIKEIRERNPAMKIILGHGSGSFGHAVAAKFQTRNGVNNPEEWVGFSQVWHAARKLNVIVMDIIHEFDIPGITIAPSSFISADNGNGYEFFKFPFEKALSSHLIPVVHGDVIFDYKLGGTILSTEDIFLFLSEFYQPEKILLAGIEEYIWTDFPERKNPIKVINPSIFNEVKTKIGASNNVDVTGGMIEKVRLMVDLVIKYPKTKVSIFSGKRSDCLIEELFSAPTGTIIEME